jgi:hypothetical protein
MKVPPLLRIDKARVLVVAAAAATFFWTTVFSSAAKERSRSLAPSMHWFRARPGSAQKEGSPKILQATNTRRRI